MREKLNKNYIADSDNEVDSYPSKYDKSLFYKRFKSHFDRLLNQDKNSTDFQELEKVYVEQKAIQNQLGAFIGSNIDNCQFIIGPTGIGKSTNLRKFFDFKTQTPSIRHKNLIIPILCNELHIEGNGSSLRVQLANIIETACMLLERDFKEKIMYSDEEFYDFILANKADVLTRVRSKPNLSIEENLLLVYQNKKFSYVTEKIKYYLRKIDDDITKLTLVIDDIDAIKCWELIRNLIREACGTWECVRNDPEKKYNVKLLISEREETHRHLHKEYTEQWITAYIWEDEPIYICEGPPLAELFKKRFDCITEIEKNDTAANLEKWEIAYDALNELVSKTFTKRNEEIITCLNNRNVRGTLTTVAQILSLGDWIEKNPRDKNYHFDVTVDKFNENIDVIQILRAIGYYNKFYYRDDPPRSRMPNILYNKEDSSTDLIGLYIIKFFLTQYEHLSNNTKEPIDIDILYNNIPVILLEGKSAVQKFQDVIKYFLEREVLSIHPFDDGSKKFLKLNNRGKILWDLLSENNILLELFKDDIWYESQNKIRERMLAQREAVPMRFLEEIEIISFYSKIERKIIKELFTNEQKKIYLATFGYSTVTNQLANGIKESFHKYYQNIHDRPHEVTIELNKMLDEVKSLQRTMQSIN